MMKKCFLAGAIIAAAIACQNPLTNIAKPTDASTRSITVSWHVAGSQARTLYPASYPTPSTYDVLLHPGSGNDVSQTGLTGTSWTFNNLSAVVYAITVKGKDSGGNVIVTGSGSADLTNVAVQTPTITLNYISTGSGAGQIHLSFDVSSAVSAGVTVSATAFTLVDPTGAVVVGASLSGSSPTFTYTNTSAVVGTYKMFAKFTGSGKVAMKADTIIVVQGVDTAVTVTLTSTDFTASYVAVSGLSLNTHTMSLTPGGANGSLVATLNPLGPPPSNTLVTWSSSDTNVAKVDQSGVVTPLATGTAWITATSVDNSSAQDSCAVTVGAVGFTYSEPGGGMLNFNVDASGNITIASSSSVTQIVIPDSINGHPVTAIAQNAFGSGLGYHPEFTSVVIGKNVTSIGNSAFEGCSNLTTIDFPSTLTSLGVSVCCNCTSLTSVNIPTGVTQIPNGAFWGCTALASISIPEGVTYIGSRSIANTAISTVDIPSTVTTFSDYTFEYCLSLTTVNLHPISPPTLGASIFNGCTANLKIYVPAANVDTYQNASGWATYKNQIYAGTW